MYKWENHDARDGHCKGNHPQEDEDADDVEVAMNVPVHRISVTKPLVISHVEEESLNDSGSNGEKSPHKKAKYAVPSFHEANIKSCT